MLRFKKGILPKNNEERLRYLYKFQEQLRLFHNKKAKELSLKEFRKFQQGWFRQYNNLIVGKILECKKNLNSNEKKKLLDFDNVTKEYGAIKNKEQYKKDESIEINLEDIEEA